MARGKKVAGYTRHPGSIWIDANYANLPNNEWVAANQSGLVDHDPSMDDLIKKLQAKNIKMEDVTIAFITTDIIQ